jgi:hypothetical protein
MARPCPVEDTNDVGTNVIGMSAFGGKADIA